MTDSNKLPNILFIYSDQLRADCLGCSGNPDVKTPNIDRLSNEGANFRNSFVSFPLCTPFRASLLTGKHAHATGINANHYPIPTDQTFLSTLLKNAGYQNGYIGKWHLFGGPKPGFVPPGPNRLDFDHFVGFNRGHEYTNSIFYRDSNQPYHCRRYEPDYQTDHLIEFMQGNLDSKEKKPFFGYICFGPPHFPMDMPEYWKNLYDPDSIELFHGTPNPDLQRKVQQQLIENELNGNDSHLELSKTELRKVPPGQPETEEEIRDFIASYYGLISSIDFNVGRILNWLDSKELAQDTIVFFFSDHGDMLGQQGHYCGIKRRAYKATMQVPVIIRYPGRIPCGHRPASLIDFSIDTMPTILDLCGIRIPSEVHGKSYLKLLEGGDEKIRDFVFYEVLHQSDGQRGESQLVPYRGLRSLEWLYVRSPDKRQLLFNLHKDPEEENNLVESKDHTKVMDEFDRRIEQIMKETGDDWWREYPFPPPDYVTHEEGAKIHRQMLETTVETVP